jgi:serine/threonine-protein kinase
MPRADALDVGSVVGGKYRILGLLGEGGMGSVFEAKHMAIGRVFAIKVLHATHADSPMIIKRFEREARAVGTIGHPNLCTVFDFGTLTGGRPYIVMERLHGETLAARIRREGALPMGEVLDSVLQVLAGLGAAHARGILHRDIKPDNVLLSRDPAVSRLLDFGVSKALAGGEWDEPSAVTHTGVVIGTPHYLSPEQVRARRDLDARVDIYGCGVLLYEALTGQRPHTARQYNPLMLQILRGDVKPPREHRSDLPPELERIIMKAMASERDDRHASAEELASDLARVRESLHTAPVPASTTHEIPVYVDSTTALPTSAEDDATTHVDLDFE